VVDKDCSLHGDWEVKEKNQGTNISFKASNNFTYFNWAHLLNIPPLIIALHADTQTFEESQDPNYSRC
jgi:hypothetical protein